MVFSVLASLYASGPLQPQHHKGEGIRSMLWSPGKTKPININNFSEYSLERVVVKFGSVLPFSWAKKETRKQNSYEFSGKCRDSPGTIPGLSRDNPVKTKIMCSLDSWFSSGPIWGHKQPHPQQPTITVVFEIISN